MRYVFLRLFLTAIEQPPILVETGDIKRREGRQDYLMGVLNKRWEFTHRGSDLIYLPVQRGETDNDNIVFGRIGKRVRSTENAGPDEEFEALERLGWRASNLVFDISGSTDGQKAAVEDRGDVGKPLAILNALVNCINETLQDSGWFISVNAIIEQQSFWDAAEKYKGQITRAEFSYITPNVLGLRSKINERLKEYREKENAQTVSVVLSEPKGNLVLETEEVRDAVEYTSEGGGSTKLKVGREVVFDSEDTAKARDYDTGTEDFDLSSPSTRSALAKRLLE